jgi:ubiquinone/menaquinone biosynthesis C-methylase UbiE
MLLRNKKNIQNLNQLQQSYDELYRGFLKENSTDLEAEFMLSLINIQKGDKLLDVSCGKGFLVWLARQKGLDAIGIEISRTALELAKINYPDCQYIYANAEDLPFEDNYFDFVTNLGSLEHYLHPEKTCLEMSRVLKPEGRAVILLPNSHDILTIYNIIKFGKGPDDGQDFERFAARQEWQDFLSQNGFTIVETHKFDRKMNNKPFRLFNFTYNLLLPFIPLNLSRVFVFIAKKAVK